MLTTTILTILFGASGARAQDKEGFTAVKKEGNVTIFERWIPSFSNPDVKVRELKAQFYYRNSLEAGLQLLRSEQKAKAWRSHLQAFKVYPLAPQQWLEYTHHDVPWPLSDQDHFLKFEIKQHTPRHVMVSFQSVEDNERAPVKEGVTRISLQGSWSFELMESSGVKVTYRVSSIPIGIPRVFTDPIIRGSVMTTVKNYVKLLEQP
jgi:hypothetical protein